MNHTKGNPSPKQPYTPVLDCDVAVVGAGIIGVCSALELQKAGFNVCLIDRKGVGQEATFGNAGHLATEHILPLSYPKILFQAPQMLLQPNGPLSIRWRYLPHLIPWLARFLWAGRPEQVAKSTKAISNLNKLAMPAYRTLAKEHNLGHLIKEVGSLVVYEKESNLKAAEFDRIALSDFGIATELLNKAQLLSFDATLNPSLAGGLYFPESAHITNPERFTRELANCFKALGGHFIRRTVKSIESQSAQNILHTSRGQILSKKLVIACGAWSKKLIEPLGYKVPLETERGYHLMLANPSQAPKVPTTSYERRFVATNMEGGLRLAGRVELGGLTLPMKEHLAQALMPLGQKLLPDLRATETSSWMGFRPTLPDSLPIIATAPNHKSIYLAFGHHHLGLTQGAITSQLIRELVEGRQTSIDITPYRIDRF